MGNPAAPPLKMSVVSIYKPKYDPEHPRGQDAHFIADKEQWIGVFDGVGGSLKHGIDSGVYANELMLNSLKSLVPDPKKHPTQVLEEAYSSTTAPGSSTACILSFSGEEGIIRGANVGDSGFLVIGDGEVLYRSPRQQWSFNHPYQLGTTKDDPSLAVEIEVSGMDKGYFVLLATDGLLDNMYEPQMLDILSSLLPENHNDYDHLDFLEDLCKMIAILAVRNSLDSDTDTPFSAEARRAGFDHTGGKTDDITLVLARIE